MKSCKFGCLYIIAVLLLCFCVGACGKKYNIEVKPYVVFEEVNNEGGYLLYIEIDEHDDITTDFYYHDVKARVGFSFPPIESDYDERVNCNHLRTAVGSRTSICKLIQFSEDEIEEYKEKTIVLDFYDYFGNKMYITSYEVKVFDNFDFSTLSE